MAERPPVTPATRITLIGAPRRWYHLRLAEMWSFRDLFLTLGERDVKLRYRQTALGVIWVVLQPLLAAGIFAFVFGSVAKLPSGGHPYFVFAYAGLLGWNAFSVTVTRASGSLLTNAQLVAKVYFPRLILPLSTLLATAVDFLISAAVLVVLMIQTGTPFTWRLVLVPAWLLLVLLLALGVGLLLGGASVRYRDVALLTPVALQMLLYISPIAYASSAVPDRYATLFSVNPMTGLLEGLRWSILGDGAFSALSLTTSIGGPALAFFLGLLSFRRQERTFADVI